MVRVEVTNGFVEVKADETQVRVKAAVLIGQAPGSIGEYKDVILLMRPAAAEAIENALRISRREAERKKYGR